MGDCADAHSADRAATAPVLVLVLVHGSGHQGHGWSSTSPELFGKVVTGFIAATTGAPGEPPGELAGTA